MKKHLIAGLMSLGIAFAGVTAPAPAKAAGDDVGGLIAGAVVLFMLTQIFDNDAKADNAKDKDKVTKNKRSNRYVPPRAPGRTVYRGNYWKTNRVVPSQCFYRYSANGQTRGVFGERCMKSVMGQVSHLPSSGRRDKGRQFSRAPAFDADCLRARGYRVEARRH